MANHFLISSVANSFHANSLDAISLHTDFFSIASYGISPLTKYPKEAEIRRLYLQNPSDFKSFLENF